MEELIKLSVIIPTSNRSKLLEKALLSITNQLFPKDFFEVIVVDNGSTDNTKDVAEKYSKELNLVYLYEPKPGLHEGRHAGFRIAKSDILVYADDDIEAFPEWLETIYKVFQKDENIVLVGGKNLPKFECTPPFWILKKWNNIIDEGHVLGELSILDFGNQEQEISPYFVFGCNFSVRKFIINNAGGFHPDGMPFELIKFRGDGETYISNYIKNNGYLAYYHPLASIYHWVPKDRMTEEYFFKRSYIQGVSDAYNKLRNVKIIKSYTKPGFLNKLKYFFKIFIGLESIKILEELKISVNKTDFEKNILKSYQSGYDYLHKMYHQDDEIKNWVHKKNYL
jgi:glycosyltransferase involved in cell wall biosynthesis